MRILMFGRGGISTIYGRVLAAAGHDVEFYVRLMGTVTGWATARVPIARRALAAHTDQNMVEGRTVLRDTSREARRHHIPAPRLET